MATSRVLAANWYDYPRYYDIAFQAATRRETNFIEAACRKYCSFDVRRFLEPACGSGRLITEFAARGYHAIGFDLSRAALSYLRRRLAWRRLHAETFEADMSSFRLGRPVDAAYCIINTFRHLLTEHAARAHLECIAGSLRPGGVYVLGMNIRPLGVANWNAERWTERRGETKVTVMQRVLGTDLRNRIEHVRVCLIARSGSRQLRLRHEFQMRTYTRRQFRRLLASVPALELCDVYNAWYDIDQPLTLHDEIAYAVFILRRPLRCKYLYMQKTPHFHQARSNDSSSAEESER
jgi:SAM-dependent methyltransferase